jgi:hypothetical protein
MSNGQTDFSRLTNPTCTLRGTGWNRFQPMCLNSQDKSRWFFPGRNGINNRLVAKDNHCPRIPVPMDQSASLPNPNAPAPDTHPMVGQCWGVFTGPLHEYYTGKDC